jgi:hypothetical protein
VKENNIISFFHVGGIYKMRKREKGGNVKEKI